MPKAAFAIPDVKPVKIENSIVSVDGELLVLVVKDKRGNTGHIALDWLDIGISCQLIARGAEKAAARRRELKKSDDFIGGPIKAQLVKTFQVSDFPDQKLKVLSLQSLTGLRCDFAIRTDMVDQRGRSYPHAIAEELIGDTTHGLSQPH